MRIDIIYVKINHRNRLIYILMYMKVKKKKCIFN